MSCTICTHENKNQIEEAVLTGVPFDQIADQFSVKEEDIKKHCLTHLRIGEIAEEESQVLKKVKSKELLLLQQGAFDYYLTMKSLSRRINTLLNNDELSLRNIPKAIVDLYLGSGNGMRQMIDSLFSNMNLLTGDGDKGLNSLADLVVAIQQSKEMNNK